MECASAVSSTTSTTFSSKESSAIWLVTVLGSHGGLPLARRSLDAGHEPRAAVLDVACAGTARERGAVAPRLGRPLDRRVVVAVLLDAHAGQAVQALDLDQAGGRVEALVLDRVGAGGDEG